MPLLEMKLDLKDVVRATEELGGAIDQIPFALMRTMNDAAFETRKVLIDETWPKSVHRRASNFPGVILNVGKATKNKLQVDIHQTKETTVPLVAHAEGGEKVAKKRFAIPMPLYRQGKMGQRGLYKGARVRALIERTPPRAIRVTPYGVFLGGEGRLWLAFVFKQRVNVPSDVPFYETFTREMDKRINDKFAGNMEQAMATRRVTPVAGAH